MQLDLARVDQDAGHASVLLEVPASCDQIFNNQTRTASLSRRRFFGWTDWTSR